MMMSKLRTYMVAAALPVAWLVFDAHDFGTLVLCVIFSAWLWRHLASKFDSELVDIRCFLFCVLSFAVGHAIYWVLKAFVSFPAQDTEQWLPWLRSELRPEADESVSWIVSLALLPLLAFVLYGTRTKISGRVIPLMALLAAFFWILEGRSRTACYMEMWHLPILLICLYAYAFACMWRKESQGKSCVCNRLSAVAIWFAPLAAASTHVLSTWDPCLRFAHMEVHMGMVFHQLALDAKGLFENHQYGLYHLWLKHIFDLIGYTVPAVSSVMALLLAVSAWAFLIGIRMQLKRRWLMLFLTVTFVCCWPESFGHNVYWQYNPVRTLFPMSAVLFWSRLLLLGPRKRMRNEIVVLVSSTLALFWNFDYGLVVFLSSILLVGCVEFVEFTSLARVFRTALVCCLVLCVTLAGGFAFVVGHFGDACWMLSVLEYQRDFYGSGYYMLPLGNLFMTEAWVVLSIYLIGFWRGFCLMMRRNNDKDAARKGCFLFAFSVMAFGMFTYFQGRSHVEVLVGTMWPSFAIGVILIDELLSPWRRSCDFHGAVPALSLGCLLLWMALPFSQLQRPGSALLFFADKEKLGKEHPFRNELCILKKLIDDNKFKYLNIFTSAYQSQFYLRLPVRPSVKGLNYHTVFFCEQLRNICREMFSAQNPIPFLLDVSSQVGGGASESYMPRAGDFVFNGFYSKASVLSAFTIVEHNGYMLGLPATDVARGIDLSALASITFEPGDTIISLGAPLTDEQQKSIQFKRSDRVRNVVTEHAGDAVCSIRFE